MVSCSTALTCCTSPSIEPARGTAVSGCGPSASTVHGTSTTASGGRPASVGPLRAVGVTGARPARGMARHDRRGHALVAAALDVGRVALLLRVVPSLLHVRRVALAAHAVPRLQRRGGACRHRVVEAVLLLEQELTAGLGAAADRGDRVAGEVVVVEVLVGDRAEGAQPVRAEQAPLLD